MQKIKKKNRTVKAVGPEHTHGRTNGRTYESEFIGSFRSLKTSGEPKKWPIVAIFHLFFTIANFCQPPLTNPSQVDHKWYFDPDFLLN